MPICAVEPFTIRPQHQRWIRGGIDLTVDFFHSDVQSLLRGEPFDDTWMAVGLPDRYQHHYDAAFSKQFLDVTLAVAWKWQSKQWWKLNSVAEELAMSAILRLAETVAENEGRKFDTSYLVDLIFEDTDFEMLSMSELDGIEDDPEFEREHRTENLRFCDWFRPFTTWKGCYLVVRPLTAEAD